MWLTIAGIVLIAAIGFVVLELAGMSHLVLADVAVQFARQLSRPKPILPTTPIQRYLCTGPLDPVPVAAKAGGRSANAALFYISSIPANSCGSAFLRRRRTPLAINL
jgi:hypothetical protein